MAERSEPGATAQLVAAGIEKTTLWSHGIQEARVDTDVIDGLPGTSMAWRWTESC